MRGYDPEKARRTLQAYIAGKSETVAAWSRRAGISDETVRSFLKGRSQSLQASTLEKLARADGVDTAQLLPGAAALADRPVVTAALADGPGVEMLGSRFVRVCREDPADPGFVLFETAWLATLTAARPDQLVLLPVRGDAMADTLRPGDTVLVDRSQTTCADTGLFAVAIDDTPAIKRLTHDWTTNRLLVGHDNAAYPGFAADPNAVTIFGRLLWLTRPLP